MQAQGAKLQFGHSVKRIVCEGGRVKAVVCDTPQGEQTLEGGYFHLLDAGEKTLCWAWKPPRPRAFASWLPVCLTATLSPWGFGAPPWPEK